MSEPSVTGDFLADTAVEADYQKTQWSDQDHDKTDDEWFWTLGWIAGKAVRPGTDLAKQRHRLRAAAALLKNWDEQLARRGVVE